MAETPTTHAEMTARAWDLPEAPLAMPVQDMAPAPQSGLWLTLLRGLPQRLGLTRRIVQG